MFYPLIPGFVAVLMGVSVIPPLQAIPVRAEIARPAVLQAAPSLPAVSAPTVIKEMAPIAVKEAAPARTEVAAPVIAKPAPVGVIEAPSRLSFERLRRASSRYPDTGTVEKFIELSTERPPLFGSD
jgi:hypothetical protein